MRWNRRLCNPRNVLLVVVICTSSLSAQSSMRRALAGRVLFHSSALGNNGLACIDCYADFDEARLGDGLIRAGHSLSGSASRQTYWGQEEDDPDRYPDIAHAAVFCVEHFMCNPEKLTTQQLFELQAFCSRSTNGQCRRPLAIAPAAEMTGEYAAFRGWRSPVTSLPASTPRRYARATDWILRWPASTPTPTTLRVTSTCPISARTG